jgi:hypothetical protein
MRDNLLRRVIMRLFSAAALISTLSFASVATAASFTVVVGPAPVGSYYITHTHIHGPGCGHYRVWNDGLWVYYYGGRWEYYTPADNRLAYYRAGYVPSPLRGHVSAAKSYRFHGVVSHPTGSGKSYAKATAPHAIGHAGPGPAYRPAKGPGPSAGPGPSKGKGGGGHGGGHKK